MVNCLMSQKHASVSQGQIGSGNCTCCHTEIDVEDQSLHFTQSQYTDTGLTSPSADPIKPGTWQDSHRSTNFEVTNMTQPGKRSMGKAGIDPGPATLEADITARPTELSPFNKVSSRSVARICQSLLSNQLFKQMFSLCTLQRQLLTSKMSACTLTLHLCTELNQRCADVFTLQTKDPFWQPLRTMNAIHTLQKSLLQS